MAVAAVEVIDEANDVAVELREADELRESARVEPRKSSWGRSGDSESTRLSTREFRLASPVAVERTRERSGGSDAGGTCKAAA